MPDPDAMLRALKQRLKQGEAVDWSVERDRLRRAVAEGMGRSVKAHEFRKLTAVVGENRDLDILDYGCGGVGLVLYLTLLGYRNVRGVDVGDIADSGAFLAKVLGLAEDAPRLVRYDGQRLPFEDESFDVIISEMVLEHVQDLDAYYREAARVLRPGGTALLDFMPRLAPYDSHARLWFVHWLPGPVRNMLYDRLTPQGADYFVRLLNLHGVGHHRRLALRYFSRFVDDTKRRLRRYDYAGVYEGNQGLRMLADKCIRTPLLGGLALSLLAPFACVDIRLTK